MAMTPNLFAAGYVGRVPPLESTKSVWSTRSALLLLLGDKPKVCRSDRPASCWLVVEGSGSPFLDAYRPRQASSSARLGHWTLDTETEMVVQLANGERIDRYGRSGYGTAELQIAVGVDVPFGDDGAGGVAELHVWAVPGDR